MNSVWLSGELHVKSEGSLKHIILGDWFEMAENIKVPVVVKVDLIFFIWESL